MPLTKGTGFRQTSGWARTSTLYHVFLSPTIYMDTDKKYTGLDQNDHTAGGFTNYTTFSLWDTYRALHPLFTIVQQAADKS